MSAPDPQPVIPIRLDYAGPDTARPLLTILQRTLLAFAAGILPLIGFFLSGWFALVFAWKSGKLTEIILLPYHPVSAWPFYILIVYAIYCTGWIIIRPAAVARSVVRSGVHIGLAVEIQYILCTLVWCCAQGQNSSGDQIAYWLVTTCLVVALVTGFGILIYRIGSSHGIHPARSRLNIWAWCGLGIGGIGTAIIGLGFLGSLLVAALQVWPLLAYATMTALARRMTTEPVLPAAQRPILLTTFYVGYSSACGVSLVSSLFTYNSLPTHPFTCYVATAAARGHRRFVRSQSSRPGCAVNDQMRFLRAAELMLHCVWPSAQRAIRRAYDRVGPPLAGLIVHPLMADAAYLLIKPFEWAARVFLRVIVTDPAALAARLYPHRESATSMIEPNFGDANRRR